MPSSRARTQDKTSTATGASESAALIGGEDKSNSQLYDDGERGRGSGRKRQRQQQHERAPVVDLRHLQWRQLAAEVNDDDMRQWQWQRHLRRQW